MRVPGLGLPLEKRLRRREVVKSQMLVLIRKSQLFHVDTGKAGGQTRYYPAHQRQRGGLQIGGSEVSLAGFDCSAMRPISPTCWFRLLLSVVDFPR
jgi:hypothetical protein